MVRIGELMTMVVAVEGPTNTDLQVRECVARDGSGRASYKLTDKVGGRGCGRGCGVKGG